MISEDDADLAEYMLHNEPWLVVTAEDGLIRRANWALETLFGYATHGELVGLPVEVLLPEACRDRHARYRQDYQRSPYRRPMGEGRLVEARHKSGRIFQALVALIPLIYRQRRSVVARVYALSPPSDDPPEATLPLRATGG